MWAVYIPKHNELIEADSITMDFRVNAVSTAQIVFKDQITLSTWSWLYDLFTVNDIVQIKYKDKVIFNGFVYHIASTKTQKDYQLQVTLQDPLGKLTKMPFQGGFSGRLQELLHNEICTHIGVNNRIISDAIVNIYYEKEVTRYSLLFDACAIARYQVNPSSFGFYYNHQLNAICELNDPEAQETLQSLSNTNRISINQSYGYTLANVIQVRNY